MNFKITALTNLRRPTGEMVIVCLNSYFRAIEFNRRTAENLTESSLMSSFKYFLAKNPDHLQLIERNKSTFDRRLA
jgi:hypothetical protein